MIRFKNPIISKMKSGRVSIELTEAGTWESFSDFAIAYSGQINATLEEEIVGPDVRFWYIRINGIKLRLAYDDFPNGIFLESDSSKGDKLLNDLYTQIKKESDQSGI